MAFDVIDRIPAVLPNDPLAKKVDNLHGAIEFRNVNFSYPSRRDQKILNNFSVKFEVGKTTALVGPSGSGKSTII